MRETPKQREERLLRINSEQKNEISDLKKQRRSMQYEIKRLKKTTAYLENMEDEIETLKREIENLKSSLNSKEELFNLMETYYKKEISQKDSRINRLLIPQKNQQEDLTHHYEVKFDRILESILDVTVPNPFYDKILKQYQKGDRYYNILENGKEKIYPIFSPDTLFIQVHPDTGKPLTEFHKKLLNKWGYLNTDYLNYFSPYKEWLDKTKLKLKESLLIEHSYRLGKELLPLYRRFLF